VPRKPARDDR